MEKNQWWNGVRLFMLLVLAMICLSSAAVAENEDVWALFQQQPERVEGQAYIELVPMMNPVKHTRVKDMGDIWKLDFWLAETNGVGFTIEEERIVHFDKDHRVLMDMTSQANEMIHFYVTEIEANGYYLFNDAYPRKDERAYIGILVTGTDANGNRQSFPMLMELSQEPVTAYTLDDFAKPGTEFEDLLITCLTESPIPLTEDVDGLWWITQVAVCNTSSEPMKIKEFDIIYFDENREAMNHLHMEGKSAALMLQGGVEELPANSAMLVNDWAPNEDRSAVALRFVLTNAQGEERTATVALELSKEVTK